MDLTLKTNKFVSFWVSFYKNVQVIPKYVLTIIKNDKMAGKNTVARLLGQHKAAILRDLDVNRVLPRLIKNEVITQSEEKHILGAGDRVKQCEVFLDILSKKGVGAFHEFCASLEESSPHLLTGFLLENPGKYLLQ